VVELVVALVVALAGIECSVEAFPCIGFALFVVDGKKGPQDKLEEEPLVEEALLVEEELVVVDVVFGYNSVVADELEHVVVVVEEGEIACEDVVAEDERIDVQDETAVAFDSELVDIAEHFGFEEVDT
jgi:hypothetical protein